MPICIECRYPVSQLYHVLHSGNTGSRKPPPINRSTKPTQPNVSSKGEPPVRSKPKPATAALGGDVRLTQCPRCKRFADKYVEHDYVVLFIDLVLVKPQVRVCVPRPWTGSPMFAVYGCSNCCSYAVADRSRSTGTSSSTGWDARMMSSM